ncbi:hypothetical protein DFH01_14730 [Falsiroseomonas bella]|uniref:Outer membrane protein n=1 Tax=Falsiroseomonas bella TaxID=2184016 RepID=A0A317FDG0_9PROT|nr:hypothetical protein [Falsiroseomonas bella]PWS36412.1 hypothetical protein DFH01_14730 [Falsiroseomonas bella]
MTVRTATRRPDSASPRKIANLTIGGALLAGLFGAAQPAVAQTRNDGWEFSLSPYVWFAGVSGDVTLPRGGNRDFSADFGDVFDSLKFGAMATAEARRGRFGVVLDFVYLENEEGFNSPRSIAVRGGDTRLTTTELSVVGLFRAVEQPGYWLDVGGGLRAWWLDTDVSANQGLLAGRSASASSNWVDPLIAARGQVRLSEAFSLTAYGDVGGFDTGSKLTWQAIGSLDWRITPAIIGRAGWRYMAVDRSRDNVEADIAMSGPFLGVTFRF